MASEGSVILVGTIGQGIWYSQDGGERWRKGTMELPLAAQPGEIDIRALTVSPHDPAHILAGSEVGVFESRDYGKSWRGLDAPVAGREVWSIAVHPTDPDTILVGTKPPAVFRTRDGGKTWQQLPFEAAEQCLAGAPRVTNLRFDPNDDRTVWAGVEIDGVFRSQDGGDTWEHLPPLGEEMLSQDVHGLALLPGKPSQVLATTPVGVFASTDGRTWAHHQFPREQKGDPRSYCRGVLVKPDDASVILVGTGDYIPGSSGSIQWSRDGGETWQTASLPSMPNSVVYALAAHPAIPDTIAAASLFGHVFLSGDGGTTWRKAPREFGEVRSVCVTPA